MDERFANSDAHWRERLTPEQYRVTREKGTERAFAGGYYRHDAKGVYLCVCCGQELFDSEAKFDSGSGWPSFFAAHSAKNIATRADAGHGMRRTEVTCSRCAAHLGHIFDDGPAPTGLRYCINSAALDFREKTED